MNDRGLGKRLTLGAAAGFVGTLALQGLRTASQKWLPQTMPPIRKDPGEFVVEQVEEALPGTARTRVPDLVETAAARSLAVGYGLLAGTVYAALRPTGGNPLVEGTLLGLAVWAAGYLGWLPALEFTPPLSEQSLQQGAGPIGANLSNHQ
jgi:hypothetical protein